MASRKQEEIGDIQELRRERPAPKGWGASRGLQAVSAGSGDRHAEEAVSRGEDSENTTDWSNEAARGGLDGKEVWRGNEISQESLIDVPVQRKGIKDAVSLCCEAALMILGGKGVLHAKVGFWN